MKEFQGLRPLSSGPIRTVDVLYEELRELVYNATNLWSWRYNTTTMYRMRLPGLVEVVTGGQKSRFLVHRFLLENTSLSFKEKADPLGHTGVMTTTASAEVHAIHATANFPHIILLLKLRWLLKLHAALCELDHKICSLKNFITGLHRLSLQECEAVPCDNGFASRALKQVLNVPSLMDDMIEQLQRSMGQGFDGFLHFVQSCDSRRALCFSSSDTAPPRVQSTAYLAEMIDDIFMAHYLRLPASNFRVIDLITDLEGLNVPPPQVYTLKIDSLKWWKLSTSSKTKLVREKSAQLQALRACASIELEELGTFALSADTSDPKPELTEDAMEILFMIVGSHQTFPSGFRERLVQCLRTCYTLSEKQTQCLAVLTQMNLDIPTLSAQQAHTLKTLQLDRMHKHTELFFDIDLTCLVPSLVPMPLKLKHKSEYAKEVPLPNNLGPYRSESVPALAMMDGRDKFRVPLITGPLVYDHRLQTLRTTGYFQQMANLGP